MRLWITTALLLLFSDTQAWAQLHAAVLPSSGTVQVGQTATAFATIINAGSTRAMGCSIMLPHVPMPVAFAYQTTNPDTNQLVGTQNTPVDIPAGGSQSFVTVFTPSGRFGDPITGFDVGMSFDCTNTDRAPIVSGLNTFRLLVLPLPPPPPPQLYAAVLPSSRSVQVGQPATAFATIINTGSTTATRCSIAPATSVPATFSYQATNPVLDELTGTANTPVDIPAGESQSFMFGFAPTLSINATIQLTFACTNLPPAPITFGVNTFRLVACTVPVADYISVAATPTNDGIVTIPGASGTASFSVAVTNVGAPSDGCYTPPSPPNFPTGVTSHRVTAETTTDLVSATVCRTDAAGQCQAPPTLNLPFHITTGEVATFSVFVKGNGTVPFSPATNRVTLRFGVWAQVHMIFCDFCPFHFDILVATRGSTSVAVRTRE